LIETLILIMTSVDELALVDRIITYLGVPQKLYRPISPRPAELEQYPVEFHHLTRVLHRLGEDFFGYKVTDAGRIGLPQAVLYSILGEDRFLEVGLTFLNKLGFSNKTPQELCNMLHLNLLIVGPDETQVQVISWVKNEEVKNVDVNGMGKPTPYVMLYRSYENSFYPIVSLEKRGCYLVYYHNNILLQKLSPVKST